MGLYQSNLMQNGLLEESRYYTPGKLVSVSNDISTNYTVMETNGSSVDDGYFTTSIGAPVYDYWQSITYCPQIASFVAVGSGNNSGYRAANGSYAAGQYIATKPSTLSSKDLMDVDCNRNDGTIVAVAYNRYVTTTGTTNVFTSTNGVTWVGRTTPTYTIGATTYAKAWNHIKYYESLGLYIATSYSAYDLQYNIMTSPDASTWTVRFTNPLWYGYSSCYSKELGLYLMCGAGSIPYYATILSSTDGITWTTVYNITGSVIDQNTLTDIVWSSRHGLFVAVFGSKAQILTSPNGVNWTIRSIPQAGSSIAVDDRDNLFVITSGTDLMSSSNGTSFSLTYTTGTTNWNKIKFL